MNPDQTLDAFMALEAIALEARQLFATGDERVSVAGGRLLVQVEFLRSAIACAEVDE